MAKTFQDIINSMKSFIRGKNSSIDLSEGSITNDIVILAPGQEISKLYDEINTTSQGQSLETASDSAVESLGKNVGLLVKSSRSATGTITFFSRNAPVNNITISAGSIISTYPTGDIEGVQFIVTSTVVMYSQLSSSYLNTSTGVYEISTSIEAVKSGISGIVGPNTINQLVTAIPGIDGCYNSKATYGGLDVESTDDFKIRIASKWRGNSIGVYDGYLSEALEYPGVEDAMVFGGVSSGRNDLGPVDIYIRGKKVTSVQDTFIYYSDYPDLVLSKQPIVDTESISIFTSQGGPLPLSSFTLTRDTGGYAGSIKGQDKIHWNSILPSSSGSVMVNYSYNSLIYDLQNYFSNTSRKVQNVDLLVKWTTEILINLTFNIKVSSGFDSNSVISTISSQLALFFSRLKIGALIRQSDIAEIILSIPGVSDLKLPLDVFRSNDGSIIADSFNNLQLPSKSYAVLGTLIINIV